MNIQKILPVLKRPIALVLALFMLFSLIGCSAQDISDGFELAGDIIDIFDQINSDNTPSGDSAADVDNDSPETIAEDGYYYSKDDVALYIHTYGKLPQNFITKDEAGEYGWSGGSVEPYFEGGAIGGDRFGNREGLLAQKSGRVYYECDIDTLGKSARGEKRIVYSNDGLIYYTDDHYGSFTLLYGEE